MGLWGLGFLRKWTRFFRKMVVRFIREGFKMGRFWYGMFRKEVIWMGVVRYIRKLVKKGRKLVV